MYSTQRPRKWENGVLREQREEHSLESQEEVIPKPLLKNLVLKNQKQCFSSIEQECTAPD